MKIYGFSHKGLRRFYEDDDTRGIPTNAVEKIRSILIAIQEANSIVEIEQYPGWRLHPLSGDRKGQWSIVMSGNWRLVFELDGVRILNIDLVDYH